MTFNEIPYFLTNEEWFYFDEENYHYVLTTKAPPKAVESYKEFYKELEKNE